MIRQSATAALLAIAGALALGTPAWADQPAARAISNDMAAAPQFRLDPAKAYLLINVPIRVNAAFLRAVDDATRAAWQADFDKAFAKAKKAYPARLASWRTDVDIAKQTGAKAPEMPAEPTAADIVIDPVELRDQVAVGPMFVYAKAKDSFTYLEEVNPGTYIAYGSAPMPEAQIPGACLCMGTVSFAARAGVVTDISVVASTRPMFAPQAPVGGYEAKAAAKQSVFAAAYHAPAEIAGLPVIPADLHAYGKINNFNGGIVMRLSPIPGVLDYRRDTVVDVRTGQALPNPVITSREKPKT